MVLLDQFIEDTNKAESSASLFQLYRKALKQFGYDRICYCLVTDHPSYGLKASHGIAQNYPESWVNHYTQNGYEEIDPVLQHCFKTNNVFSWDWLVDIKDLPDDEQRLMDEAAEEKLLNGLAIPVHGINRELTAIGLASSELVGVADKDTLAKIRALSLQFHISFLELEANRIGLPKDESNQNILNVSLSDREREILLWMSDITLDV